LVAFDGHNYLVTWVQSQLTAVYARRIGLDGRLLDFAASDPGIAVNTNGLRKEQHATAFAGVNHLIAWQVLGAPPVGLPTGIYAARVTPDGVLLDEPASSFGLVVADLPGAVASPGSSLVNPVEQSSGDGALLFWVDVQESGDLQGSVIHGF
jgi:hypothetical protein